jgi:L-alanine-DL-glutamate epimerase-like enolase superfamily enzyme
MRIVDIRERSVPISRYNDPRLPSGGLTTSAVAIVTDVLREGKPIVGFGFGSMGRFAQGGLIRERFAPRLLDSPPADLQDDTGSNLDPFRAWDVMLRGEKPGGHGERCVAVGTLDMALWDVVAKVAEAPLYRVIAERLSANRSVRPEPIRVYAGGGYPYPEDDVAHLKAEVRQHLNQGYTHVKIKIGSAPMSDDLRRVDAVLTVVESADRLALDAMNTYSAAASQAAAGALNSYRPWWFEDICDPLDFESQAAVAAMFDSPIAAGEALFSVAEARLLSRYAGLRRDRDILLFDPVHCYGLPGYLRIIEHFDALGWPRTAFWPHGGHLFCLHLVSALGLGGAEINPLAFSPFGGLPDGVRPEGGRVGPPDAPGIGFELKRDLHTLFRSLLSD